MRKMINFPKIKQFRDIIKDITYLTGYLGVDDNGNPIYTKYLKLPTLNVSVSEKIHGTNAGVAYNNAYLLWVQSRKNIITPEKDNAGFASFVKSKESIFIDMIKALASYNKIDLDKYTIILFGEWAGGNIQKNSAFSGVGKHFIIFEHFKVVSNDDENDVKWYNTKSNYVWLDFKEHNILNIMNFKNYSLDIDFENPSEAQNTLVKIVEKIEENSPVGQKLGKENNIGEGVVVSFWYKDILHMFKVKGEKHSATKVKTLKEISPEMLETQNKINEVAEKVTRAWRLEQMFQELYGIDNEKGELNIKDTRTFLKMVNKDILEEEEETFKESGLEFKQVVKQISKIASTWFREQVNKI